MREFTYEIVEEITTLSENRNGWQKQVNLISWNGGAPKYDIRDWSPEHKKIGKGVTLSNAEIEKLYILLKNITEK